MQVLLNNIMQFVAGLRQLGLRVGTAETITALTALNLIDLTQREQVKSTLRAVLAKSAYEREVFDRVFDSFFVPPDQLLHQAEEYRCRKEELRHQVRQAARELRDVVTGAIGNTEWHPTTEQVLTFAALPSEARSRLQHIFEQMRGNEINHPGQLITRMIASALNFWRYHLLKQRESQGLLITSADDPVLAELLGGVPAEFVRRPGDKLYDRDLQYLGAEEAERVAEIITRMAGRLRRQYERRYRFSPWRQVVDLRRTARVNLRFGGVPLYLRYRARRARRLKLLVICDVSASMARYAQFVLQFLWGLSSARCEVECFLFSEDLEYIGQKLRLWGGRGSSGLTELVNNSRQWGKTTDLYRALLSFKERYLHYLTGQSVLLILSDTRTLHAEQALAELRDIKERVLRTVWLVPLPRSHWSLVPTVELFQRELPLIECYTLAQLERALSDLMLSW